MDESALQHRLDAVERRQSVTLALLAGLYVLAGLAAVVWIVPAVTARHASALGVVVGLVALVVGIARRRRAR